VRPKIDPEKIAEYRELKKRKKQAKKEQSQQQGPQKSQKPEQTPYRDRAKERREAKSNEYDEIERELQASGLDTGQSKYLGGDLEHTHLVKGLDYALLAKVKSEIEAQEREKERKEKEAAMKMTKLGVAAKHVVATNGTMTAVEAVTEFKTSLGKAIYRTLFEKQRPETSDLFLKGRTSFVFDLDPELNQQIPTTVTRSKEDVAEYEERSLVSKVSADIINRLQKIMIYFKQSDPMYKKLKKKEKNLKKMEREIAENSNDRHSELQSTLQQQQQIQSQPEKDTSDSRPSLLQSKKSIEVVERDEDSSVEGDAIFEDVEGKYEFKPDVKTKEESSLKPKEKPKSYFSQVEEAANQTAPKEVPEASLQVELEREREEEQIKLQQQQQLSFVDAPTKIEKQSLKQKTIAEKKTEPLDYAECYPGTYEGVGFGEVDDEDTEDFSKMDSKQKLRRWDFETDEDWVNYEQNREAVPKAAFQFGVKMKDGRKAKTSIAKKQKLGQQLKKIQEIIERKQKEREVVMASGDSRSDAVTEGVKRERDETTDFIESVRTQPKRRKIDL
jgi:IK cytokine